MDSHNVGRQRVSAENALAEIKAKTLIIGIDTDLLFPPSEQRFLAAHISGSMLSIIHSIFGHDGFLLEYKKIENAIDGFLASQKTLTPV